MVRLLLVLIALAIPFAAAFVIMETPDTDPEAMLAKYGGARAHFAETTDGLRIHYRDQGNPDGPTIILVHGTAASLQTWEPLVERLGGAFRVITYDQPGHGLTGPAPDDDYAADAMMRAVSAVAKAAGAEHFILGGNSMGGWVAWRYALDNPGRVDALILIDAAGAPDDPDEPAPPSNLGFRLLKSPFGRFVLQRITPRWLIEKSIRQSISNQEIVDSAFVDRHWELLRYPGNRHAAALRITLRRDPSYAARLDDIQAPSLIIWGAEDPLISPADANTFDRLIPHSEIFILNGVGHIPMEEAPDLTADAIEGFIDDVLTASPRENAREPAQ